MYKSLGWQQAVKDLADDNKEIRKQRREIARWFPSMAMMRNHALGLVKVMHDNEKARAFPTGYGMLPPAVLLWAMREVQCSPDPRQRSRWWMYRSPKMTPPQPDPTCLASMTEGITDVVPAIPAPVNTTYWDQKNPTVIFYYNCEPYDESEVQMVAPAKEGDQDLPIDVDELPEILVASAVIKQEVVDANAEGGEGTWNKKKKIGVKKKTAALEVVHRSERLKMVKKTEAMQLLKLEVVLIWLGMLVYFSI
ncbi:hypothetical protein ZWY2020_032792 [Hordeum vulgare]|nr:hypothetical protein ZWY2020_032792 [Hordeum vulgare]